MPNIFTLEETYDRSVIDGHLLPQDSVDILEIKSILSNIDEMMKSFTQIKNASLQYLSNYKILQMLAEAILLFEKVKTENNQCLFAALCVRHPELDLDWGFFEKLRLKNETVSSNNFVIQRQDYKDIEFQSKLYTQTLYLHLKKQIKEFDLK